MSDTLKRKLGGFYPGQQVTIKEYLGHTNVHAIVVEHRQKRVDSERTLAVRLEQDAGHPKGTVLYYYRSELHLIEPRFEEKSK